MRPSFAPAASNTHYEKILVRLLAAHAMAEKLTAFGYERALKTCGDDPALRKGHREKY